MCIRDSVRGVAVDQRHLDRALAPIAIAQTRGQRQSSCAATDDDDTMRQQPVRICVHGELVYPGQPVSGANELPIVLSDDWIA